MIKYCIFDLDGTLLDTLGSIRYYLNRTLSSHGYREVTKEECKSFIGDGARMLVTRALKVSGEEDSEAIERVLRKYNAAYDSDPYYLTEAYPGIVDALSELSSHGVTLAVLSNKPDSTAVQVVTRFFGNSFSTVRGGREGVPLKPDPRAALDMIEAMGAGESEVAFIGDTAVDIETGRRARVGLTLGVSWGFRDRAELISLGADAIADTAEDLTRIIIGG